MKPPRLSLLPLLFLFVSLPLRAGGGMWLPLLLEQLNEAEMRGLGMRISAEDIYSVNHGSLKDAIVHFGGFCTGEIVSDRGLILTNHHCGYSAIQSHSSLDDNLLEEGFWAEDAGAEKSCPDLFVTFVDRMEDVTARALAGVTDTTKEKERARLVAANLAELRAAYPLGPHEELLVKPFHAGNQYFAFVTVTYPDVRLVGAPPSSIGKFGADTDNWEWPRHTGDFSLFRVYADSTGAPAAYDPANRPLRPKHHLRVSTAGVRPGDFSMVLGFPGRTDQYLPASAIAQRTGVVNPIRTGMRDLSLAIIDSAMRADPALKIAYASKQARIANAWKKWRGERAGIARSGALDQRRQLERDFGLRLATRPEEAAPFTDLLPALDELYARAEPYAISRAYVAELNYNSDLFRVASLLRGQLKIFDNNGEAAFRARVPRIAAYLRRFYAGYSPEVDRRVTAALLERYSDRVSDRHRSRSADDQLNFAGSLLTRGERLVALLEEDPAAFVRRVSGDPAYRFVTKLNTHNERRVLEPYNAIAARTAPLQREYLRGLMRFFPERRFYPDANGTLRLSYGQFGGFRDPEDGQWRDYVTYLDGVIDKYRPGDYEFDLPPRLLELYLAGDFGPYADSTGRVPVCLLGSNHTTGGNSGSPALNADGHLVGLNFDRTWQSTMSDLYYDPAICRNIMVDIRYVLFLIDKLGGAGHLVAEMDLVGP